MPSDDKAADGIFESPGPVYIPPPSPEELAEIDRLYREMKSSMIPSKHKVATFEEAGLCTITRTYKDGRIVSKEEASEDVIEVKRYPATVPIARVGYRAQMVVNMGNYETVHLGIEIQLPCVVEELDEAYRTAKNLVDLRLNREVDELRDYRRSRAEGKGV